jgi:hypothetical protein
MNQDKDLLYHYKPPMIALGSFLKYQNLLVVCLVPNLKSYTFQHFLLQHI